MYDDILGDKIKFKKFKNPTPLHFFMCGECGSSFTNHGKFCLTCLPDPDIDLVGYCSKCDKITDHEDLIGTDIEYICMECETIFEETPGGHYEVST